MTRLHSVIKTDPLFVTHLTLQQIIPQRVKMTSDYNRPSVSDPPDSAVDETTEGEDDQTTECDHHCQHAGQSAPTKQVKKVCGNILSLLHISILR